MLGGLPAAALDALTACESAVVTGNAHPTTAWMKSRRLFILITNDYRLIRH